MLELLKMIKLVADLNVNTIWFTYLQEPIVHTQHNGSFKPADAPKALKELVDYMVANNVAEITNWDNYDAWNGRRVRFDGPDENKTAEVMAKIFSDMVVERDGRMVVDVKIDDVKFWGIVSKEVYDTAVKVAA